MLGLTPQAAALAFLVPVAPLALWICYTDMKYMKIRNGAVLALLAIFAVVGLAVLPLPVWAWRWVSFAVVLMIGFLLNAFAGVGAGDAKYAAAAAPFVVPAHATLVLPLFAAFLLGAFAAHRVIRRIPAVRRAAPDWVSWTRADFPMGLAISGTLVTYLLLAAFPEVQRALISSMM